MQKVTLKIIIPGDGPRGDDAGEQSVVSFAKNLLRTVPALFFFLLITFSCLPTGVLAVTCPNISPTSARQNMSTLENAIRYHNHLYYEKAQPEISDAEYDRLFASLIQLEECFPDLVAPDSPSKKVGSDVEAKVGKVKHEQRMLSLSSSTGPDAVKSLLKRIASPGDVTLLVQPKVDGLPVELVYEEGRLVSAATRGDGRYGEDVTERVRHIQGIPLCLTGTFPARVVMRGEIYADLQQLKASAEWPGAEKYATPRHAAAGVLQSQETVPSGLGVLRLFPFELVSPAEMKSDRVALTQLSSWGFLVDNKQSKTARTLSEIREIYRFYLEERHQQPFAMDGIVVKVDDMNMRRTLGEGERAPLWAAAWKFPPETARTRVLGINWTAGRTGRRTPVAELAPVDLGGVQVSRVSLNNEAELARLDIAAGDQVVVGLIGDVIPQLLEVVERTSRSGASAAPLKNMVPQSPDACLTVSAECHDQFLARVTYFASKSGLAISGLGRARLKKLIDAGVVTDLPSLFRMQLEQVAAIPGFTPQSAQRLIAAIRVSAARSDDFRVATALGISGVGPKSVQRLARKFNSLDALLAADHTQYATLASGDVRAVDTIKRFFNSPGGAELLENLRELGVL